MFDYNQRSQTKDYSKGYEGIKWDKEDGKEPDVFLDNYLKKAAASGRITSGDMTEAIAMANRKK